MIPSFGLGQVLPPFTGSDETGAHGFPRSPYAATALELVQRFGTSTERGAILRGLLDYRAALRAIGITSAIQWIDGSFVENCEVVKSRPPADIDVVTLLRRPSAHAADADWDAFINANAHLFLDHGGVKATYQCDAYFIDLDIDPILANQQAAYWFGLFSHQRTTFRWKGLVQLDLMCDDPAAAAEITALAPTW